mmetsp:Transcript_3211/g.10738  ORF Transcript_3211/g.10738 Transcript_3211/m.10738 type:complete len:240 (-) Transcript_3211:739-1458(-)
MTTHAIHRRTRRCGRNVPGRPYPGASVASRRSSSVPRFPVRVAARRIASAAACASQNAPEAYSNATSASWCMKSSAVRAAIVAARTALRAAASADSEHHSWHSAAHSMGDLGVLGSTPSRSTSEPVSDASALRPPLERSRSSLSLSALAALAARGRRHHQKYPPHPVAGAGAAASIRRRAFAVFSETSDSHSSGDATPSSASACAALAPDGLELGLLSSCLSAHACASFCPRSNSSLSL